MPNRRTFMGTLGTTVLASASGFSGVFQPGSELHLSVNQYSWVTFFQREDRDFLVALEEGLTEVVESGFQGFEPSINKPEDIDGLERLLDRLGLEMRSIYVNSLLHEPSGAEQSRRQILEIAERARRAQVRIVVTNPTPIRWGGSDDKTDDQLKFQAQVLQRLGEELGELGLVLAYHNHDPELRQAAREFHHMMIGTDPALVGLCLDAHWIYRGSGNSQVALFDMLELYGSRVVEVHLRQSDQGIWSEVLGEGDIDYPRLAERLAAKNVRPHLVVEQAPEKGTPHTLSALESLRRSGSYARSVFKSYAG